MRQYSTFSDARVMLVNYHYVIVYDTYSFENNKTIISENVIKAFTTKRTSSSYNRAAGTIEIMTPVLDITGNASAVVVMNIDACYFGTSDFMDSGSSAQGCQKADG